MSPGLRGDFRCTRDTSRRPAINRVFLFGAEHATSRIDNQFRGLGLPLPGGSSRWLRRSTIHGDGAQRGSSKSPRVSFAIRRSRDGESIDASQYGEAADFPRRIAGKRNPIREEATRQSTGGTRAAGPCSFIWERRIFILDGVIKVNRCFDVRFKSKLLPGGIPGFGSGIGRREIDVESMRFDWAPSDASISFGITGISIFRAATREM